MPLIGNIEDLKWSYDEEVAAASGSPILINTRNLEVRVILLEPGVYPPYHAHHNKMDEGYLICGGRGLIHNGGETFDVEKGNVLLNPRGEMHHMKNIGKDGLIEFNFRGGLMPSQFILPECDPPWNPDPESVENPALEPNSCILGNALDKVSHFDPHSVMQLGLPTVFSTEFLELRVVSFEPGAQPETHRHLGEVDEATLILGGRLHFYIDDDEFVAGPGDLVHVPGGAIHYVNNTGMEDAIIFNFIGGRLPAETEWMQESPMRDHPK